MLKEKVEKLLKEENIKYTITPAPRELSTCCGITIRIKPELTNRVQSIVKDYDVSIDGIQSLEVKSYFNI
jgi:ribosomal protein L7Ae-like RNA K-turn-binding protein